MNKKIVAVAACVALLLAGGIYYLLSAPPASQEPAAEAGSERNQLSYSGSSIVEEHDGKRLWELSAETIEIDPETKNVTLKNLQGTFYQKDGGKIIVTAKQGWMDGKTRDVRIETEVKAVADDGATFTAARVDWLAAEQRYHGSGGVRVTRDDTVLTGDQLDSDVNLEKIKVSGNARIQQGGVAP